MAPAAGQGGVDYSLESQRLRDSDGAYAGQASAGLRQVGDKAFLLADGIWTDTTYRQGTPTTKVTFGSDAYFALISARPAWGRYFALGERVIVVLDGVAYEVVGEEVPPVSPPPAVPQDTARPAPTPGDGATSQPDTAPGAPCLGLGLLLAAAAAGVVVRWRRRG